MKKVFLILAFCSIITFFFVGYSKGMDCSVYDDLINTIEAQINLLRQKAQRESNGHFTPDQVDQVLLTSKYSDEFKSLKAEYDSAVQQKNNCENDNSSINYQSNNNSYNKSQNQLCKEEFGTYSIAIGDECKCKDGYGWDSPDMNRCVNMTQSCRGRFGVNSIASGDECFCKAGYGWDSPDMNSCVPMSQSCKGRFGVNSIASGDECFCKAGYGWDSPDMNSCVPMSQSCKGRYGVNSIASGDKCLCKDGYGWNNDQTACIIKGTVTTVLSPGFANKFSIYKNIAYDFAFNNQITTMPTVEQANMYGSLDRIAMAKMISNYAINVLGLIPNSNGNCTFKDVPSDVNEAYDYGVTKSCQLGLMGQGIKDFRPYDKVTRAEFATVLSRLVNRDSDDLARLNSADPYYTEHMKYLESNGIIDDVVKLSISNNEIRGYVMLMLMRAQVADNDTAQEYYDSLGDEILSCAEEIGDISENFDFDNFNKIKETCNESLNNIVNIGSWNGDATLFNAIIEYNLYLSKFLDALYKYTENPTDKLEKEFDDVVYYMENTLDSKFDDAEQAFADKYGVDIE